MLTTRNAFDLNVLVNDLLARNQELTATNAKLAGSLDEAVRELSRLREKCEELAAHIKRMTEIPTQFSSGPLWMSEEEEDLRLQHDQGSIDTDMLRSGLEALGLNPTIEQL